MKKLSLSLTVIIPVHNAELYVEEAITSLLCQHYPVEKILVINDGSKDRTADLVKSFIHKHNNVEMHSFPNNRGVSAARNFGVRMAKTSWVLFLDADDIAGSDMTGQAARLLSNSVIEPVLIHSAVQMISENGDVTADRITWKQTDPRDTRGYFFLRNRIPSASGVLVRKSAFEQVGGFREDLRYGEDWDLWLRLSAMGVFLYGEEATVYVRRHASNTSAKLQPMMENEIQILKQYELRDIEAAVKGRQLPEVENIVDYVSILCKLGYLDLGLKQLAQIDERELTAAGWFYYGILYWLSREWGIAYKHFAQTVSKDPKQAAAWNNLGVLEAMLGDSMKAKGYFARALEISPNYMDATHNLHLLKHLGNLDEHTSRFTDRLLRSVLIKYTQEPIFKKTQ